MQGSFSRKPPTTLFTALLQPRHSTQLRRWFYHSTCCGCSCTETLSKRPHMFRVGFSWGFNTFTSDGRNTAPSASFSPLTQICLSHPWPAQMLCIAQLICLETSTVAVCALWAQADAVVQKHLSSKFGVLWLILSNAGVPRSRKAGGTSVLPTYPASTQWCPHWAPGNSPTLPRETHNLFGNIHN